MSEAPRLPAYIKLRRLAQRDARLEGTLPLSQFTRLAEHSALSDNALAQAAPLEAELEFFFDEERWLVIQGVARCHLPLVCQRCMQGFNYCIDLRVSLVQVASDEEANELPGGYEPLVFQEDELPIETLLEDDLLLALPLVPLHPEHECQQSIRNYQTTEPEPCINKRKNPFKVLEQLKLDSS